MFFIFKKKIFLSKKKKNEIFKKALKDGNFFIINYLLRNKFFFEKAFCNLIFYKNKKNLKIIKMSIKKMFENKNDFYIDCNFKKEDWEKINFEIFDLILKLEISKFQNWKILYENLKSEKYYKLMDYLFIKIQNKKKNKIYNKFHNNKNFEYPIHWVSCKKNEELIKQILLIDENINYLYKNKKAIYYAQNCYNQKIIQILVENGAELFLEKNNDKKKKNYNNKDLVNPKESLFVPIIVPLVIIGAVIALPFLIFLL